MSAGGKLCGLSVGLGTLAAGVVGTVLGPVVALTSWGGSSAGGLALAGALVGGIASFFIGWLMAWNGAAVRSSGQTVPASALWGLITGTVLGMSLGPLICGSIGLILGQIGLGQFINGLSYGLLFGLFAGVIGWQVAFWTPVFLPSSSPS